MHVFADGEYTSLDHSKLYSHLECDRASARVLVGYFITKGYWFLHRQIDTNTRNPIIRLYMSEAVTIAELTRKFPNMQIQFFIH